MQVPKHAAPFSPVTGRLGEADVAVMSRVEAELRDEAIAAEEHPELMRRFLGAENRPAFASRFRLLPEPD